MTRRIQPNNFDALRLLAALMVILGHGQDMKGFIPTILWNFPISRIGLDIFFSISGYLVCDSWLRSPHLPTFLLKRALRIVPALFVCVALTALVLGPLVSTTADAAIFRPPPDLGLFPQRPALPQAKPARRVHRAAARAGR